MILNNCQTRPTAPSRLCPSLPQGSSSPSNPPTPRTRTAISRTGKQRCEHEEHASSPSPNSNEKRSFYEIRAEHGRNRKIFVRLWIISSYGSASFTISFCSNEARCSGGMLYRVSDRQQLKCEQIALNKKILVFQLLQLKGQFVHRFRDFGNIQLFGNNR